MQRATARLLGMIFCLACLVIAAAFARQATPYPRGHSVQTYKGRDFELVIPDDLDEEKTHSLVFMVNTSLHRGYTALSRAGYILCAPKRADESTQWATSEAKDLHELLAHLVASLPIGKNRLHASL